MGLQNKEVLVVDDDPTITRYLEKVLSTISLKTIVASNVDQAIELAKKRVPHLLLTDLNMPGESGFDLLERRRALPELSHVPAIVISGKKDRNSIYRALSLGATDYIVKPISLPLLVQKVRKALQDREFLKFEFAPKDRPRVNAEIKCRIHSLNEVSFFLVTPVKLAPQTHLGLRSAILSAAGIGACVAQTQRTPAFLINEGEYGIYVNLAGLPAASIEKIRQVILNWKA